MGPGVLSTLLKGLNRFRDERLIVGFEQSDDASVYAVRDDLAVIQTIDFFPPIVDDPYTFGQIAAANAISDIYAMGGEPKTALNLLCAPSCLPLDVVREILAGGADKAYEAGISVSGGHSIADDEPKYGLAVTGFAHPQAIRRNSTARVGDVLVLTKPLGSGVLTTALKDGVLKAETEKRLIATMVRLNRQAAALLGDRKPSACTDVTGFGLIGHAAEMAEASGCTIRLFASSIPLLPEARAMAADDYLPGGGKRNRSFFDSVRWDESIDPLLIGLMYDAQTSGGLLAALPAAEAVRYLADLAEAGEEGVVVGEVLAFGGTQIEINA